MPDTRTQLTHGHSLSRRARPEELNEKGQHPAVTIVCLDCLINDNPESGRGLDIAREYGVADLDDDGEWVVGDLSRLEPN